MRRGVGRRVVLGKLVLHYYPNAFNSKCVALCFSSMYTADSVGRLVLMSGKISLIFKKISETASDNAMTPMYF